MRFQLLGDVAAETDGERFPLGEAKHRAVLAALLVQTGQPVSVNKLTERVWGIDRPRTACKLLRDYISDLRKYLDAGQEGTGELLPPATGASYRALIRPENIDLHRFRDLFSKARQADGHDNTEVVGLCREAIAQWNGEDALADITSQWAERVRIRLAEDRKSVRVLCLKAELRLGRHGQIIGELADLTAASPLDEQLMGMYMLACYRARRPGDAETAFQVITARLLEDSDSAPGPALLKLRRQILARDPALDLDDSTDFTASGRPNAAGTTAWTPKDGKDDNMHTLADKATKLTVQAVRRQLVQRPAAGPSAKMIELLRRTFDGDETAEAVLTKVEGNPGDPAVVRELRSLIVVRLEQDVSFRKEVDLLAASSTSPAGPAIVADSIDHATVFQEQVSVSGDFNIGR
ncbi:MAG TPA: AfsR/SARP family transcriptional regulator [Amycolatopsis sp.]|uniref:AfsR/SARP family transcriptional regulator n=1 Tax=Amycolatopsis sp. TaxID=37632 RepID=UPI002B47803A|nr:AfsR/SARP family transcriptional regulator [Amycolatopsis sp.]HKS44281.1 AfsR/SARP family transcriptional regulator [Amycolatopsis sp.]